MFSFSYIFPILDSSSVGIFDTISDVVSTGAAFTGSSCFLAAFIPQFLWTYKTQNTLGLNKKMFWLHYWTGVLFFVGAFYLFILGCETSSWAIITQGLIFSTLNLISSTGSLYTILKKGENVKNAAALGISEESYYLNHLAPLVKQ